jgi:hypothetical protein
MMMAMFTSFQPQQTILSFRLRVFSSSKQRQVPLTTSDDGSSGVVASLKTTHIVIHKQTLSDSVPAGCSVKTPSTPLPPPTPATPRGRERGFRYQWDSSAFEPVLPVRCKNSSGELHKSRFGSGRLAQLNKFMTLCYIIHSSCSDHRTIIP